MYINKRTTKAINILLLRTKVAGKNCAKAEHGSPEWHKLWDECEYAHKGVQALLGDKDELNYLRGVAEYNDVAATVLEYYVTPNLKGVK